MDQFLAGFEVAAWDEPEVAKLSPERIRAVADLIDKVYGATPILKGYASALRVIAGAAEDGEYR